VKLAPVTNEIRITMASPVAYDGRIAAGLRPVDTNCPCLLLLIEHARRCTLGNREMKLDSQTRRFVGHDNVGAMQIGNRCNQAKTEAVPRPITAALEPIKPSQHVIAFFDRNSRSSIADRENRPIGASRDGDLDLAPIAAMLDRVVDKIGDRVEQEIAIADRGHCFTCRQLELDGSFLRRGLEQFYNLANDLAQIGVAERSHTVARLDLRDPQQ
jgi:hypothetical protein